MPDSHLHPTCLTTSWYLHSRRQRRASYHGLICGQVSRKNLRRPKRRSRQTRGQRPGLIWSGLAWYGPACSGPVWSDPVRGLSGAWPVRLLTDARLRLRQRRCDGVNVCVGASSTSSGGGAASSSGGGPAWYLASIWLPVMWNSGPDTAGGRPMILRPAAANHNSFLSKATQRTHGL